MVSYASNHLLLRAHGCFGSSAAVPVEFWSAGMRCTVGNGVLSEEQKAAFLDDVKDLFQNLHVNAAVRAGNKSFLTHLTAAYIGTNGRYLGGASQPTTEYRWGTAHVGSGSHMMPFSVAKVFTLGTDIDRGRGSVGRFYWPCQDTVDAEGKWTAISCADSAAIAKTTIDGINTALRQNYQPASSVSVFSGLGSGEVGTVVRVGVGRGPDSQRRRDNKIREDRVDVELATTAAARDVVRGRVYTQSVD